MEMRTSAWPSPQVWYRGTQKDSRGDRDNEQLAGAGESPMAAAGKDEADTGL